jgi:hypothetical protein
VLPVLLRTRPHSLVGPLHLPHHELAVAAHHDVLRLQHVNGILGEVRVMIETQQGQQPTACEMVQCTAADLPQLQPQQCTNHTQQVSYKCWPHPQPCNHA